MSLNIFGSLASIISLLQKNPALEKSDFNCIHYSILYIFTNANITERKRHMVEFLTTAILGGIIWDGLKKSVTITKDWLKEKVKNWALKNNEIKQIVKTVNNAPDTIKQSEKDFLKYIEDKIVINKQEIGTNTEIEGNNFGPLIPKNKGKVKIKYKIIINQGETQPKKA